MAAEKFEDLDDVLDDPPDFYLDVSYVIQTWLEHKLHHTYPDAGGYNDQSAEIAHDWHIMNLYYSRVQRGVISTPPTPDNASPWQDLMRD